MTANSAAPPSGAAPGCEADAHGGGAPVEQRAWPRTRRPARRRAGRPRTRCAPTGSASASWPSARSIGSPARSGAQRAARPARAAVDCATLSSAASRSSGAARCAATQLVDAAAQLVRRCGVQLLGRAREQLRHQELARRRARPTAPRRRRRGVTSRLRMLARWPGLSIRPRSASPASRRAPRSRRSAWRRCWRACTRSAAEPVVGETCPTKPCACMSAECARATSAQPRVGRRAAAARRARDRR